MENLEQVFNAIVKDYSERLYWHVRRMVGTHEDADDLLFPGGGAALYLGMAHRHQ